MEEAFSYIDHLRKENEELRKRMRDPNIGKEAREIRKLEKENNILRGNIRARERNPALDTMLGVFNKEK